MTSDSCPDSRPTAPLLRRSWRRSRRVVGTVALLILGALSGCAAAPAAMESPADYAMMSPPSAPAGVEAQELGMADESSMAMDAPLAAPAPAMPGQAPMAASAPALTRGAVDSAPTPAAAQGAKEVPTEASKKNDGGAQHLIIFTGQLQLEVAGDTFAKSIDAVVDVAVDLDGYIAKQDDHSVTVRVPSGSFREALRRMEKIGTLLHRGVDAQDVSEEFNDLGVRLKSLLATRDRLQQFLDRAKSIEEVLRVEQELGRLNGEIDRLQGRMRFLSARAAFSTITVSLSAKPEPVLVAEKKDEPPPPPPPPPPPRTIPLPIEWLGSVGLDQLLNLN